MIRHIDLALRQDAPLNEELIGSKHPPFMRDAMAAIVALLFLNFMDEQVNDARYTRAAISIAEKVFRSFG